MRTILIPKNGVPFFGEDARDDRLSQPIARLAQTSWPLTDLARSLPSYVPVEIIYYEFKGTVVQRGGQPVLAIYEERD